MSKLLCINDKKCFDGIRDIDYDDDKCVIQRVGL